MSVLRYHDQPSTTKTYVLTSREGQSVLHHFYANPDGREHLHDWRHAADAAQVCAQCKSRACQDHDIIVEHRPPRESRYGCHIERGFGTWLARALRLKVTTFSNVVQKADYDSEGRAIMTRAELEKWFTIYVTKVYANTLLKGIKTTPLAKYKEGI